MSHVCSRISEEDCAEMGSVEDADNWWRDEDFPVGTETLAGDVAFDVIWLRPHELCNNPKLFVDGASRLDTKQGKTLGNCWCIAACAALAEQRELVKEVTENVRISNVKDKKSERTAYHSFTVTGQCQLPDGTKLVRVRNPWGEDSNTLGKWRYNFDICKELSREMNEKLMICPREDGEYWVDVPKFFDKFEELCIASKHPSVISDRLLPSTETRQQRGEWKKKSAGGPPKRATFKNNPQFLLVVAVSPEAQDKFKKDGVPVFVELIQDFHRLKYPHSISTGFYIYQINKMTQTFEEQQRYSPEELDWKRATLLNDPVNVQKDVSKAMCIVYQHYRMVPDRHYVVVPFTVEVGQERPFLLRVHTADALIRLRALPDVEE